mgnify:CR=1 FL=1
MKYSITTDSVLSRYANRIAYLSDGQVKQVFSRALNHEGDKGRTQVKRSLVTVTGIKYSLIDRALSTKRANRNSLEYRLDFDGEETNLNLFKARQTKKGVSAAPWNVRRIFSHTFMIGAFGGKVYRRVGAPRFPIKAVYGPNLAREVIKGEPAAAWRIVGPGLADRIGHEISRFLKS